MSDLALIRAWECRLYRSRLVILGQPPRAAFLLAQGSFPPPPPGRWSSALKARQEAPRVATLGTRWEEKPRLNGFPPVETET